MGAVCDEFLNVGIPSSLLEARRMHSTGGAVVRKNYEPPQQKPFDEPGSPAHEAVTPRCRTRISGGRSHIEAVFETMLSKRKCSATGCGGEAGCILAPILLSVDRLNRRLHSRPSEVVARNFFTGQRDASAEMARRRTAQDY